jgi:hypothetical protein
MIVLSPLARGGGYFNQIPYTHSSMLRTVQEIFGAGPWLEDAANATNLSDLFTTFGFSSVTKLPGGEIQLTAVGAIPDRTHVIEFSTNLFHWAPLKTNVASSNTFTFTEPAASDSGRFYRLVRVP